MPAKKKDDNEITVVAYLEVTWPNGTLRIRQFDKAWAFAREIAEQHEDLPVNVNLLGWLRKDDPKEVFVMKY